MQQRNSDTIRTHYSHAPTQRVRPESFNELAGLRRDLTLPPLLHCDSHDKNPWHCKIVKALSFLHSVHSVVLFAKDERRGQSENCPQRPFAPQSMINHSLYIYAHCLCSLFPVFHSYTNDGLLHNSNEMLRNNCRYASRMRQGIKEKRDIWIAHPKTYVVCTPKGSATTYIFSRLSLRRLWGANM